MIMRGFHPLIQDRNGAAAIEFALILPLLLILSLGMFEIAGVISADMKLANATQLVSDLVAQQSNETDSLTANFCTGGEMAMAPLSGTSLKATVVSVTHDSGGTAVDWQDTSCGGSDISNAVSLAASVTPNVGDSVIIVVTNYQYTSPLDYVLSKNYTLTQTSFSRPRNVATVTHS